MAGGKERLAGSEAQTGSPKKDQPGVSPFLLAQLGERVDALSSIHGFDRCEPCRLLERRSLCESVFPAMAAKPAVHVSLFETPQRRQMTELQQRRSEEPGPRSVNEVLGFSPHDGLRVSCCEMLTWRSISRSRWFSGT